MTGEEFTYRKTMEKLLDPVSWDVDGIVSDIRSRLRVDDGEALAVIDYLLAKEVVREVFSGK